MRNLIALFACATCALLASDAMADVPLRGLGAEASTNLRGGELRLELGNRMRWGGYLGFAPLGDELAAGATASRVFVRHRQLEVRLHGRLGLSRFGESPNGLVVGSRFGVRSMLRSKVLGFSLGPVVDTAVDVTQPHQERISPGLGAAFGGGPPGPWPWLWLSGDVGYTVGGQRGGAVRATWFLSLVFDR
jgi:hypothetical protein